MAKMSALLNTKLSGIFFIDRIMFSCHRIHGMIYSRNMKLSGNFSIIHKGISMIIIHRQTKYAQYTPLIFFGNSLTSCQSFHCILCIFDAKPRFCCNRIHRKFTVTRCGKRLCRLCKRSAARTNLPCKEIIITGKFLFFIL